MLVVQTWITLQMFECVASSYIYISPQGKCREQSGGTAEAAERVGGREQEEESTCRANTSREASHKMGASLRPASEMRTPL